MKHILKYGLGCLMLVSATTMISCGENEIPVSDLSSAICPSSIKFDLSTELSQLVYQDETGAECLPLIKGETIKLEYTLAPENITYKDVIWTSSNPEAVTVDNGNVTAVSGDGLGYSIVQVAPEGMFAGSGVNCNLKVVVSNSMVKAENIQVTASADKVYGGESIQLTAGISPVNATYRTVKWISSDESIATVDVAGVVTGKVAGEGRKTITITAQALDGSGIQGSKEIVVEQIIQPQDITIDQNYAAPNYLCAIGEKQLKLNFTTVPEECTRSLIQWTSSDETIATVKDGVVTFNQNGVFGEITITAICPETGKSSSIKLNLAAGLVRELFHDKDNYSWYNAKQSGNGTSSSHEWHYGYVSVTTYTQNATKQRGDFKCWSPKTWLHAGNYPIVAIRMQDCMDLYEGVTTRNLNLDTSGSCGGTKFSGNVGGNNNKWAYNYQCSDGSRIFIYDLSKQSFASGGLLPTTDVAEFTTLQFKYADIGTLTKQVTYNVYWVQTFRNIEELQNYVTEVEGLTYEIKE